MDHHKIIRGVLASGVCALALSVGAVHAQEGGQSEGDAQAQQSSPKAGAQGQASSRQQLMQTQRKLQSLQKELGQLQQKTLKENPELVEQREQLKSLVRSSMQEKGIDPEKQMTRMQEIRKQMQSDEVAKSEKQKLAQEMRQRQRELQQARQQAFQDKEIRQKTQAFREDLLAAMKSTDEDAEALIQEFRATRQQLQQQMQQMRQQQQRGGGAQPQGQGQGR